MEKAKIKCLACGYISEFHNTKKRCIKCGRHYKNRVNNFDFEDF